MAWAGWGAGPAGAGSAGGPGRVFLWLLTAISAVAAGLLLREGKAFPGLVAAAGTAYFGLRAVGRLGPRRGGNS